MKTIIFLICTMLFSHFIYAQTTNENLIFLAKTYKNYMFRTEIPKKALKTLKADSPKNLEVEYDFIRQTITKNNKLLSEEYISIVNHEALLNIYIIRKLDENMRSENAFDNNDLIQNIRNSTIPRYELVKNYYNMLFMAIGNKNTPFNLSKFDLKLDEYNLLDETEKGILFLKCMDLCGTIIWGYMNVVSPPNTDKAFDLIKKYPTINGAPYYQYNDLYFADFKMIIETDKEAESFKAYYISKLYETVISHMVCLSDQLVDRETINDFLLGSILKEHKLYKYTKYKDMLEKTFQKVEK